MVAQQAVRYATETPRNAVVDRKIPGSEKVKLCGEKSSRDEGEAHVHGTHQEQDDAQVDQSGESTGDDAGWAGTLLGH